jgi:hypothetical protein
MGKQPTGCRCCGGMKVTRYVVQTCETCRSGVCEKHVRWRDDKWICTRCLRAQEKRATVAAVHESN